MRRIRTVMLRHVTPAGTHHDWLLEDPAGTVHGPGRSAGKLVSFRVGPATTTWASTRKLHLTRLPDHRRSYLHYQGPISDRRGWVRRIDAGWATVRLWREDRAVLEVTMQHFQGLMQLRATVKNHWTAGISPKPGSNPPPSRL